mgnify:CR=1 FL=1
MVTGYTPHTACLTWHVCAVLWVIGPELFLGGKKLTLHGSNADDPYITVGDDADASEGELEDLMVLPTDNIIVVGSTEEVRHLACILTGQP